MTTELWFSVEQVAQHLGVAKGTVYRGRDTAGYLRIASDAVEIQAAGSGRLVRAGGADQAQDTGGTTARKN